MSSLNPRITPAAPSTDGLPPLIELDRATVVRGQVKVLHGLSLRIAQGQHTALLGPNGCGKSTFIKLITRELYPLAQTDGSVAVKVLGQNRWQVDRLRSQLGIVTGDLSSNLSDMPGLTVEQAVLSGFFASYVVPAFREITADMLARVGETLALTGATALRARAYAELSAGETRRVLIARALVNRPQALLLDEPSTGLDLVARQQLVATMRRLAQEGITLVLVTHHIEEVIPEIERVVLLRDGRVLADGNRDALLCDAPLSAVFGGPITVVEHDGRLTAYAG
ncbi:ATP-binding cassette domain-containing protein [Stenotrophomonas sp. 24(2023)]|uniref:ABC transporter ATP-binding protein n=1 Tax=Stenotrophomonas sp. 24(2023) TaxID=3068324 RepID=UPI0027E1EE8C|nr:ATP-binding cassette domain-containing protein [Stenotrophomonas sp. 24(2023)]WMJ71137.1 ATP-binding cassette domain-containing protein [Stenotrophomonas sp. 24(2023)]